MSALENAIALLLDTIDDQEQLELVLDFVEWCRGQEARSTGTTDMNQERNTDMTTDQDREWNFRLRYANWLEQQHDLARSLGQAMEAIETFCSELDGPYGIYDDPHWMDDDRTESIRLVSEALGLLMRRSESAFAYVIHVVPDVADEAKRDAALR